MLKNELSKSLAKNTHSCEGMESIILQTPYFQFFALICCSSDNLPNIFAKSGSCCTPDFSGPPPRPQRLGGTSFDAKKLPWHNLQQIWGASPPPPVVEGPVSCLSSNDSSANDGIPRLLCFGSHFVLFFCFALF